MPDYAYRLVNVFARPGEPFSGNPLCVFEAASGLDERTMQALALQFNLSETTFVLPSERASARVRIFTPSFEMPFAGHPTLGTAHVLRALLAESGKRSDEVTLEMKAGVIPVSARGDRWTLRANAAKTRPVQATRAQLAAMLGLETSDIGEPALWVDTGSDQLIVPVTSPAALARCQPSSELLQRHGCVHEGRYLVYAFAHVTTELVHARMFFNKGTSVIEDPATGSACANLGGYLVHTGAAKPIVRAIEQGVHVGRPCELHLEIDAQDRSLVSGLVFELARGYVRLP
ncbi:MAG TPA: PhzF family phenazine biosynthesis protein [Polyangiales bacterium]|nr:PhzF family phenazine biosynthesis protein [Polyangiales bacterium]